VHRISYTTAAGIGTDWAVRRVRAAMTVPACPRGTRCAEWPTAPRAAGVAWDTQAPTCFMIEERLVQMLPERLLDHEDQMLERAFGWCG
jgi:hypothetical protein